MKQISVCFSMSKNTRNTQFRRVDVDQYSDDKFEEDEHGDEAVINGVGPNEVEVQTLLSQYPLHYSYTVLCRPSASQCR